MRHALFLLGALAVAGCSGLFDPGRPEVGLSYSLFDPLDVPTEVHMAIDGHEVRLPAPETRSEVTRMTITARRYGKMPVRVALLTPGGDTLAALQITQLLERDHAHWVGAEVSIWRPQGHCVGEVAATPLRPPRPDTLFVMYGRLSHGAIC